MSVPIKWIFHESFAYITIELAQWWTKKAEIEPPANSKHPKYKKPEETAGISRLVSPQNDVWETTAKMSLVLLIG